MSEDEKLVLEGRLTLLEVALVRLVGAVGDYANGGRGSKADLISECAEIFKLIADQDTLNSEENHEPNSSTGS